MDYAIEVNNLKKHYKEVKAVDGISFQVEKGELFGFLGVNGAGKSTTINMLCTLFGPAEGRASVCGYELGREDEQIRRNIGVVYQNNCLDDLLSVKENLIIRGSLYEKDRAVLKSNLDFVCELLELGAILKRRFGKLSGGQKRRCEIARALMSRPQILFLDEPTTGLDPSTRQSVWKCVEQLRRETDMTVFLTTHYMEEAARARHIAVIDEGELKETGTPFVLKERYASDKLRLFPKEREELRAILQELPAAFKEEEETLSVLIPDSMHAYPILQAVREKIAGFEVLQGSMDDVFLNITGKELQES